MSHVKMASLFPRNAAYVCRACRSKQTPVSVLLQPKFHRESLPTRFQLMKGQRRPVSTKPSIPKPNRKPPGPTHKQARSEVVRSESSQTAQPATTVTTTSEVPINTEDVRGSLRDIQNQVNITCASTNLPEEATILEIMDKAYQFANLLVFGQATAPDEDTINREDQELTDKDFLSDLEEPSQPNRKHSSFSTLNGTLPTSYREHSAQAVSESLYTLLKDPKVHISQPILSTYVRIICQLGGPEFLPEIFFLYAQKPQPILKSNPIQYHNPSPNSPKNAIPQELSDVALDTAILQKDLALAIAIIDTTVSTRAFRRNKFVKKASVPLTLVGSTPIAAYAAADWVSHWQNSLDPQMAKAITLMASAAYIGTLSTIGFVAVTTWNDHHERVRWSEGTPLRYRWFREEERLYFDRIAMAWGFQRKRRRGEEMGGLWEELREECGARGMVLDKSDLLPGMA